MDEKEMKDFVETCNKTLLAHVDGQYGIIDTKLDNINEHLKKMNGKVAKHEMQINEALIERSANREIQRDHIEECKTYEPRIRELEDQQLTTKSVKRFIAAGFAIVGAFLGVIYTIFQIIEKI